MQIVDELPILNDNFAYVLRRENRCIVVDPGEADPVLHYLADRALQVEAILCTHHHVDHIGGVSRIKQATGARVVGPADPRIPDRDEEARDGDLLDVLDGIRVLATPGHGRSDVTYLTIGPARGGAACFCGDTLFVAGCGRLMEGTAATMWDSLQRLAALPDEVQVYCGHEYTLDNLRFAADLVPEDAAIARRLEQVRLLRKTGQCTVPSRLGLERLTNPFLRVADPEFRRAVGLGELTAVEAFAEIRRRKDRW